MRRFKLLISSMIFVMFFIAVQCNSQEATESVPKVINPPIIKRVFARDVRDTEQWFKRDYLLFLWDVEAKDSPITGFSYLLSQDKSKQPDNSIDVKRSEVEQKGLKDGIWFFSVKAINDAGKWSNTVQYQVKIDNSSPELTAAQAMAWKSKSKDEPLMADTWTNKSSSIYFEWEAAKDKYSGVKGYRVYFGTDKNGRPHRDIKEPSFFVRSVPNNQTSYLRVQAIDELGNVSDTKQLFIYKYDGDKPSPVRGMANAWQTSDKKLPIKNGVWTNKTSKPYFQWQAVRDDRGSGLKGYNLYFGIEKKGEPTLFVEDASYISEVLSSDTINYLRVQSVDNAGNVSDVSNLFEYQFDNIAPLAVAGVASCFINNDKDDQIENGVWTNKSESPSFRWDEVREESGSGVIGYKLYFGTDKKAAPDQFIEKAEFRAGRLKSDTVNELRVAVIDKAGNESEVSTLFTYKFDNIAPPVPSDIAKAYTYAKKGVSLKSDVWTNKTDSPFFEWAKVDEKSGSGVVGYRINFGTEPNPKSGKFQRKTSYSGYDVLTDTVSYLTLWVIDKAGNISEPKQMFVYKYDKTPPFTPEGEARAYVDNSLKLEIKNNYPTNKAAAPYMVWPSVEDNKSSKLKGYLVAWTKLKNPKSNNFSFVTKNEVVVPYSVKTDTKYYLHVKSVDNAGNISDATNMFTYLYDITPPAVPGQFNSKAIPEEKVVLSWGGNRESDLLGYNIYRSTVEGKDYKKVNQSILKKEQLEYQDTTVMVGNSYFYILRAVDRAGNLSDVSAETSAPYVVVNKEFEVYHDWDDDNTPVPGAFVKYKIIYNNLGFGPAKNITIVDNVPGRTTFVGGTPKSSKKATIQYWDRDANSRFGGWVSSPPREDKSVKRIRWHINEDIQPKKAEMKQSGYVSYEVMIDK